MGIFDDDLTPAPGPRPRGRPPLGSPPPAVKWVRPELKNIRYTHDAMIDLIIAQPTISRKELAAAFNYSETAITIITKSDAFEERLAERKAQIVDPFLRATIEDKVLGAASRAMDRIIDRLDSPTHGAIKTQDLVSIAKLAVAPKPAPVAPASNNVYVVNLPAPAADSSSWLQNASRPPAPRGSSEIIEMQPRG